MRSVNLAVVIGALSKSPEARMLPDGSTVWELDVTSSPDGQRSSSVPVSWVVSGGVEPGRWPPGEELFVCGRVRRRFYRAGGATGSRTDLLADIVVPTRQRKRVAALLADAAARLGPG